MSCYFLIALNKAKDVVSTKIFLGEKYLSDDDYYLLY